MSRSPRPPDPSRLLVPACFVVSGAAGLALEVVWSKMLSLLLGNSVHGVATAVAAFLGGLGLGAALAGRRAATLRNPLLAYALLEGVVGVLALLSPFAAHAARPLFASLYNALGGTGPAFHAVRFVLLFAGLLVPTVAMGATLPLVVEDVARRRAAAAAGAVARLYAINTVGAVAGTLAAGFVLVPRIGLARTATVAGLLDLAILAALLLTRASSPGPLSAGGAEPEGPDAGRRVREPRGRKAAAGAPAARTAAPAAAPFARWLLPAIALSGLAAILYQVAWTRLLAVPFGGIVYAFSAILAIYLLGLALGAAAIAPVLKRTRTPSALFGQLQAALAAAAALGVHALGSLPHWEAAAIGSSGGSVARLLLHEARITAIILLPPTVVLGALFPTAVALHRSARGDSAGATGAVYAANTLGSIAGSLLTAFVLVPRFGAPASLLGAAGLNALLGIAALLGAETAARHRRAWAAGVAAAAVAFALFARPSWSPERMSLGFVRLVRSYWSGGEDLTHRMINVVGTDEEPGRMIFHREGPVASVAVIETADRRRSLLINGKADATVGEGVDMRTQVFLGQLPLLFHPDARDVFVIGYGSGVTSASALRHPVREVRTVELEPAVIEAAPLFRAGAGDPLADRRHRLVIEDANLVLRSEPHAYDVIISEPSNFWIAGMANLFSDDFYRVAAARMRPGAVLCQWVHCYQVSPEALRTVVRTLARTFPHGQIFSGSSDDDLLFVVSPSQDLALDVATWERSFADTAVAADLARVGIQSPADLLRYYRGRLDRVAAEAGPGPVNDDDNGWLEHRAPLDLLSTRDAGPFLAWNERVSADLAASLRVAPERLAGLLEDAAARAVADGDSAAAAGLRAARAASGAGRP